MIVNNNAEAPVRGASFFYKTGIFTGHMPGE